MNHLRSASRQLTRIRLETFHGRRCWSLASGLPNSMTTRSKGVDAHQAFSSSPSVHTSTPQNEYLVVIPDFPSTDAACVKARPGHIRDATPLIDAGIINYFGVTMSDDEAGTESINGSAIVLNAASEVEVRALLQKDEYTKLGVWNVKDAKIWRFRSG